MAAQPDHDELFSLISASVCRAEQTETTEHQLGASHGAPSPASIAAASLQGQPYIFDMETADPDDVLTLLFLCSKPSIQLRAVTITPGTEEQVSLVAWILKQVGMSGVRIGASKWPENAAKQGCLRGHFYDNFGRLATDELTCEPADRVLLECCDDAVTLVTGAALTNLGAALKLDGFRLGRWVAQGGFAGEGVVPSHLQMDKFRGLEVCSTFNFGGNIPAAEAALASPCIGRRICVSKNVCHQTAYDAQWHQALGAVVADEEVVGPSCRHTALRFVYAAMGNYKKEKKLHDPLALAVALDESVCELAEVTVFSKKGRWGSRLAPGTGTWISIDYDAKKFQSVLLGPYPKLSTDDRN